MINKLINNKLYIAGTLLLCVLIYLLNYCVAIYQCALIFTMIAITVNVTTASSSIPTKETRTQASTTIPLSRILSITSAKLEEELVFSTAIVLHL